MTVTSQGTKEVKVSKGERDGLEYLESLLGRIDLSEEGRSYFSYDVEPERVRDAQKRVQQIVRRYDRGSASSEGVRISQGERDRLDYLDRLLARVDFRGNDYYRVYLPFNTDAETVRDALKRIAAIVRRFDKKASKV